MWVFSKGKSSSSFSYRLLNYILRNYSLLFQVRQHKLYNFNSSFRNELYFLLGKSIFSHRFIDICCQRFYYHGTYGFFDNSKVINLYKSILQYVVIEIHKNNYLLLNGLYAIENFNIGKSIFSYKDNRHLSSPFFITTI